MKVLLITTSYPDIQGSQRGIFIRKLCLELIKNGLEVTGSHPEDTQSKRSISKMTAA